MARIRSKLVALFLTFLTFTPLSWAQNCPLLGPAFPIPSSYASLAAIKSTQASFRQLLDQATSTGRTEWGPLDSLTTSFSIGVFSTRDAAPLFTHHYAAPGLNGSVASGPLNDDTLYRIGSVTKLLTVYAILTKIGDGYWDQPVTRFVPELARADRDGAALDDGIGHVRWSEVTLGALASHLSGVARDFALQDFSASPSIPSLTSFGFPPLPASSIPRCGVFGQPPCARADALALLLARRPLAQTFGGSPLYSNAAFGLLGLAAERIAGMGFARVFDEAVATPLRLNRTFWGPIPDGDRNALVPGDRGLSWANFSLGQDAPAGDVTSSLSDLMSIGRSILASSLLPAATTRAWMKPSAHTASLFGSVGRPWEIVRVSSSSTASSTTTTPPTPPPPNQIIDLYTKGGGLGAYGALLALSPAHGVGFVVLTAGAQGNFPGELATLAELVLDVWVVGPGGVEAAARQAARRDVAGTYVPAAGGEGKAAANSTVVLAVEDAGGGGITVAEWRANGTDVLALLAALSGAPPGSGARVGMTLVPVGLSSPPSHHAAAAGPRKIVLRAVVEPPAPPPPSGAAGGGGGGGGQKARQYIRDDGCSTGWLQMDFLRYGGVALDEFVLEVDADGTAVGLELPVLRGGGSFVKEGASKMKRTACSGEGHSA